MNDDQRPPRSRHPTMKGEILLVLGAAAVLFAAVLVVGHVEADLDPSRADGHAGADAAEDAGGTDDPAAGDGVDDQATHGSAREQEVDDRWMR